MRTRIAVALLCVGSSGLLVAAQSGMLMADRVQPGSWQLRPTGGGDPIRVCVRTLDDLIQLRHPGRICSRYVVANEANSATIHYSCGAGGYGRTTVRAETPQLVDIESQGLAEQSPFQMSFEARRTGACGPPRARR